MALVPYRQIEDWICSLPVWKVRLDSLNIQLSQIANLKEKFELAINPDKELGEEDAFQRRLTTLQLRMTEIPLLQLKVQLLEAVLNSLSSEESLFIEQRYKLGLPQSYVMDTLGYASRTYYKKRKQILERIYRLTGARQSILGLQAAAG